MRTSAGAGSEWRHTLQSQPPLQSRPDDSSRTRMSGPGCPPRGTHLLQRARDATRAKVAAELATLPARDLAALGDALEILGRTFEEIDHGAA